MIELIAQNRDLSEEDVRSAIDNAPLMADDAARLKLVDDVSGFDGLRDRVHKAYGHDVKMVKSLDEADRMEIDFENPFAIFSMFSEMMEDAGPPHATRASR
jgi:ClpP class serine protease